MFSPYLCRLYSICRSRRSAPTLDNWDQDKARWGPLGAWSCPVMSREKILISFFLWTPSFTKGLNVIIKEIIHLLCFLSHSPCSLCVHYKPITHWSIVAFPKLHLEGKKVFFFSPSVILSDFHHDSWCIFIIQTVNQSSGLSLHVCLVRV